jgi:uncharacterized protein (DUF362 family)
VRSIFFMVLVAACSRSSTSTAPAPVAKETATPAPIVDAAPPAHPIDAAADTVTSASAHGVPIDAGARTQVDDDERAITIDRPLRGIDAADAPVFVARGDDPAELIARAFKDLDPQIPADANVKVVIKVNLGGFDRLKPGKADDGITNRVTDAAFVRALVAALEARGVAKDRIVIADCKGGGDWKKILELSGFAALSADTGVPVIDLNHYGDADPSPRPWRVKLPWAARLKDELIESDLLVHPGRRIYLIDVPKLKAHRFAIMSLAIKNFMGTVSIADAGDRATPHGADDAWQRKWRMHRELDPWLRAWKAHHTDDRASYKKSLAAFSERLADLYGVLTPDLVLVEGMPAVQGDGFQLVVPYGDKGILIASKNGCYADWVAARFFGLADSDVLEREIGARMPPAIAAVADRYYGGAANLAKKVVVRGDDYLPANGSTAWFVGMAPFTIGTKPK